jgi:hypothetical protein
MPTRSVPCALGLRIKSGWATTVLLGGPAAAPEVLDRRITLLADPDDPETRQPYHAGLDTHEARATKAVKRLVKAVERFAHRSVARLIAEYRAAGRRVRGVGIVVGSVIDPARIPNDHIRAHAEEGRLFRTVVEQAIRACRLRAHVMVEKKLYVTAARFRRRVAALGESVDGPWRAEEKAAALAAWMVLRSALRHG